MNAQRDVVIEELPHPESRHTAGARTATAEFLLHHCPWADPDAVLLVVSELVSNAVRHTAGWWRLHLTAGADTLVVQIEDSSPLPPVARPPSFSGEGGFGWHMVQRLAGRVEVCPQPYGKTVQATWMRPSAATC
ncbi:ATP-binding protein [Streptomyces sp. NPDC002867]